MAGRQQFDRVTVIRAASGKSMTFNNRSLATPIPSATVEVVDIFAPTGSIEQLTNIFINIPAAAGGTGTHDFAVGTRFGEFAYLSISEPGTNKIALRNAKWSSAAGLPLESAAISAMIQQIVFDSTVPMRFYYISPGVTGQPGVRDYTWWTRREVVV